MTLGVFLGYIICALAPPLRHKYENLNGSGVQWMVIKVTANKKLKSDIIDLRGRINGQDGRTSLGTIGRVLVTDRIYNLIITRVVRLQGEGARS